MDTEVRHLIYIFVIYLSRLNYNFVSHSANSEARN